MDAPVYLDYNATTPVDPAVREAMLPYLGEHFGNPSSTHVYGRRAREAVEAARAEVAALIGAQTDEVVLTGCATESNNLAIQGVARALRGARRRLVTSAVRLSVGLMTIEAEITRAAGALVAAWQGRHG